VQLIGQGAHLIFGVIVVHRLQQTHDVRVRILVSWSVGPGPLGGFAGLLLTA